MFLLQNFCILKIKGGGTFQISDYKNLFPLDYVLIVDLEGRIFFLVINNAIYYAKLKKKFDRRRPAAVPPP